MVISPSLCYRFYQEKFKDYPKLRKALIPFIFWEKKHPVDILSGQAVVELTAEDKQRNLFSCWCIFKQKITVILLEECVLLAANIAITT